MPPRRPPLPAPKCILCCSAQEECHTGPVTGACVCCGRTKQTKGSVELPCLSDALWAEFRPNQFQFDLCPDSNCWHTNTAYVRDNNTTNTALAIPLPSSPRVLPPHGQEAMDTAAACIGPRCFKDMQSPAVQACRYMSLFCVKELAPAESLAAERSTLILAAAILPRLSELLFDALEIIWRSEKSDGRAQRDAGLRELALLYFCLNGVRRALEKGNVHPIIGGSLFKSAFIERVSCWIQALQDNVAFACSRREVWWDCIGFENLEQLRFRHWAVKLRLVFEPCAHDTHDTMSEVSIASDQTRSTSILTDLYMSDVSEDHIRVPPAADEDRSAHYLFYADGLPSAPPRNGYGGDGFGSDILLGTIDELAAAGRAPPPMAASDLGPCTVEKHVGYYAPPGAVMVPSASTQILLLRTDAADDQLPPGTYLQTFLDHSQSYFQVNPGTAPWERFDNRCPLPTGAPSYGHLPVPPQSHQYPRTQQQQQQQHQQQQQNEQRQQQQPPLVSPPQQQPLQPQYADWPGINDNDFPNLRRHGYGSWQGPQYT